MAYVEHTKPPVSAGFQSLPVGSTMVSLTVPTGARHAVIKVTGAPIRYRDDGPTSAIHLSGTTGYPMAVNGEIELSSREQLAGFRAATTGPTGTLEVLYYKLQ
jgi:hypothetical protein